MSTNDNDMFVEVYRQAITTTNTCLHAWVDQATAYTCSEIEALADLLRVLGFPEHAKYLIEQHAEGDDEGDAHYIGVVEEAACLTS